MRRIVVIVPEWLGPDGESVLRQNLPTLQAMSGLGTLTKLAPVPVTETPEAIWLGLPPDVVRLRQGPLTVSALGVDPPPRSMHFHVSPMSHDDGIGRAITLEIPADQIRAVTESAARLNTRSLTFVAGESLDHGLVWEGLGDMGTATAAEVDGHPIREHLPQGDGEPMLRQFIDDSINLLSALPFNEERVDRGLPAVNMLWPWGQGVRTNVPNLALRRGEAAQVLSGSLRMQGLARLAGYRHGDRASFGRGTHTRLEEISKATLGANATIILISGIADLREREKLEEAEWLTKELDSRLLQPLFESALRSPARISLFSPSFAGAGLGLSFETGQNASSILPFDERSLEERTLSARDVAGEVEKTIVDPALVVGSL